MIIEEEIQNEISKVEVRKSKKFQCLKNVQTFFKCPVSQCPESAASVKKKKWKKKSKIEKSKIKKSKNRKSKIENVSMFLCFYVSMYQKSENIALKN